MTDMPNEIWLSEDGPHEGYWASCDPNAKDSFPHKYVRADLCTPPHGYVCVPVEPTPAMISAGIGAESGLKRVADEYYDRTKSTAADVALIFGCEGIYKAMIAAAKGG